MAAILRILRRHGTIRSVCFDPTGRLLASGCSDTIVRLYNLGTMS
jgi:WD40 repeat protein